MNVSISIAVLLTCYNRKEKTISCLDALFKNIIPDGCSLNVFLVDDGSTDGTEDAVRNAYPQINIIKGDGSLFWNGGMRVAFEAAIKNGFDYYLWLNDDTMLNKGAVSNMLSAVGKHKGKGFIVKFIIVPLLPPPPNVIEVSPAKGVYVDFFYTEIIGQSYLLWGGFENKEIEHALENVAEGDVVFDIGANVGLYSAVFAEKVGETGRVIAIEPFSENVKRLKANMKKNSFFNVTSYECALSDTAGVVTLFMASDSAYLSLNQPIGDKGRNERVSVDAFLLDDIWDREGNPDVSFIKLDVEGAEEKVLTGGGRCIAQCNPMIQLECFDTTALEGIINVLGQHGYTCIKPDGFKQFDWVFVQEK